MSIHLSEKNKKLKISTTKLKIARYEKKSFDSVSKYRIESILILIVFSSYTSLKINEHSYHFHNHFD